MENLPIRKPNRLSDYDYSTSGAYFVTICTQSKIYNLSNIIVSPMEDGIPQTKLTGLGKVVEKHLLSSEKINGVRIYQYVIMPDHIHAIIVLDSDKYNKNGTSRAPSPTDGNIDKNGTTRSPSPTDGNIDKNGTTRSPSPANQMLPHIVSTFKRLVNKDAGMNIFQRGYMEHIIRDHSDFETRMNYIFENPIRWYYKDRK